MYPKFRDIIGTQVSCLIVTSCIIFLEIILGKVIININFQVSTASNTILTEESSGFKKLSKLSPRDRRSSVKYLDRKRPPGLVNGTPPTPNSPGIQYVVQTVNQQQLNNGGIFMVQNNGSNIPLQVRRRFFFLSKDNL